MGFVKRVRFRGGGIPLRRALWIKETSIGSVGKIVGISGEPSSSIGGVARLSGRTRSDLVASLCVPNVPLFRACESTTLWDLAILCFRI